jgi:hypothetical protein
VTKLWPDAVVTEVGTKYDFHTKWLRLTINGKEYLVKFLAPLGLDLVKASGEVIEVRGKWCSCYDFRTRRGPSGTACKHILGAWLAGLIREHKGGK